MSTTSAECRYIGAAVGPCSHCSPMASEPHGLGGNMPLALCARTPKGVPRNLFTRQTILQVPHQRFWPGAYIQRNIGQRLAFCFRRCIHEADEAVGANTPQIHD